MKVFVIFGPPGVGKGTQCSLLSERLGLSHVSTGSLLRGEISSGSELGRQIQSVVAGGGLVDDKLLFSCLKSFLGSKDLSCGTLLLDGVPRNTNQVAGLDSVLSEFGLRVDGVISITADVSRLVERFSKRWTCSVCGNVSSFDLASAASEGTCSKCKTVGRFVRREDDNPVVVERRMQVYNSETAPVSEMYRKRGMLVEIDGLRPIEHVYVDAAKSIVSLS